MTRAASKSGVIACPRYSHGMMPEATYQVSAAAISSVMMPGHGAERQRAGRRANLFGRLAGAFDAEIVPDAELQGGDDAEPAIGQAGQQLPMVQDRARVPRLTPMNRTTMDRKAMAVMTKLTVSVMNTPR